MKKNGCSFFIVGEKAQYVLWGIHRFSRVNFKKFQRYRNFITKIISARLVVMMLAMMMGQASSKTP